MILEEGLIERAQICKFIWSKFSKQAQFWYVNQILFSVKPHLKKSLKLFGFCSFLPLHKWENVPNLGVHSDQALQAEAFLQQKFSDSLSFPKHVWDKFYVWAGMGWFMVCPSKYDI